jgi:hypothetical protein
MTNSCNNQQFQAVAKTTSTDLQDFYPSLEKCGM